MAGWQDWVAWAILAVAVAYLLRRLYRAIRKRGKGGCGRAACHPTGGASVERRQIVPLEHLRKTRDAPHDEASSS